MHLGGGHPVPHLNIMSLQQTNPQNQSVATISERLTSESRKIVGPPPITNLIKYNS